jgi:hypothetical protein
MGASQWAYAVPYQPDINTALQDLRQKIFRSGNYYTRAAFTQRLLNEVPNLPVSVRLRAQLSLWRLRRQPAPQSIEALIQINGEEGTHSILDIEAVSATPQFGTVSPLSDQQLLTIFGTTTPTREMVAEKLDQCCELRRRWEGLYVIAYQDDTPNTICFAGFSGD